MNVNLADPKSAMARFVGGLDVWLQVEITRACDAPALTPEGRLLLGCVVWGSYVDRFLALTVPSLLAKGNLSALSTRPFVVIHTDAMSWGKLHDGLEGLRAVADVEIHPIPQPLVSRAGDHPQNKYWLMSCNHHAQLHEAKIRKCAYHLLMPDHVYAEGYFAGIERLANEGKQAIVQANISARLEDLGPVLQARDVSIPPTDLYGLALQYLHPQVLCTLMNGRPGYPFGQLFLTMIGEREVRIVSPYHAIAYLAPEVVARIKLGGLYTTVDGLLPYLIPSDVEPYVPSPEDGMAYCELSDAGKPSGDPERNMSLRAWCSALAKARGKGDLPHERFLALTVRCPLPAGDVPPVVPMSEDEMEATAREVREAVASYLLEEQAA